MTFNAMTLSLSPVITSSTKKKYRLLHNYFLVDARKDKENRERESKGARGRKADN